VFQTRVDGWAAKPSVLAASEVRRLGVKLLGAESTCGWDDKLARLKRESETRREANAKQGPSAAPSGKTLDIEGVGVRERRPRGATQAPSASKEYLGVRGCVATSAVFGRVASVEAMMRVGGRYVVGLESFWAEVSCTRRAVK
jgi:hypothetical protein